MLRVARRASCSIGSHKLLSNVFQNHIIWNVSHLHFQKWLILLAMRKENTCTSIIQVPFWFYKVQLVSIRGELEDIWLKINFFLKSIKIDDVLFKVFVLKKSTLLPKSEKAFYNCYLCFANLSLEYYTLSAKTRVAHLALRQFWPYQTKKGQCF